MFDFVDVRNRLKLGHSLESVQKGSLLFLKLMLENTDDENYRIFPLKEMPWKKVLRGEDSAKNIV